MMPVSQEPKGESNNLFPIRTVCSVTGLNPVTLRAWERRYGLIKPRRTAKGHRLYTQSDIDRINEVVRLLDKGVPVSQVGQVLDSRREQKAQKPAAQNHWARIISDMINAISQFDERRLESVYNEALSLYPIDTVLRLLIVPLLRDLGRRWESTEGSVAEEHFFGVFLRNKLGARFHHLRARSDGPKLLTACLPHEHHEIGLLIFSLLAKSLGFDIVQLGANMPLDELPIAAKRAKCQAIVLAGSQAYDYAPIMKGLRVMVDEAKVPVFVGGSYSVSARDAIAATKAIPLGEDMAQALRLIQRTLEIKAANDK